MAKAQREALRQPGEHPLTEGVGQMAGRVVGRLPLGAVDTAAGAVVGHGERDPAEVQIHLSHPPVAAVFPIIAQAGEKEKAGRPNGRPA